MSGNKKVMDRTSKEYRDMFEQKKKEALKGLCVPAKKVDTSMKVILEDPNGEQYTKEWSSIYELRTQYKESLESFPRPEYKVVYFEKAGKEQDLSKFKTFYDVLKDTPKIGEDKLVDYYKDKDLKERILKKIMEEDNNQPQS